MSPKNSHRNAPLMASTQEGNGRSYSARSKKRLDGKYRTEFDFDRRNFGVDCEFGQILRSYHSPADHQLVEIRALKKHLIAQTRFLDILELEKLEDIERLHEKTVVTSQKNTATKRGSKKQTKTSNLSLPLAHDASDHIHQIESAIQAIYHDISSIQERREESHRRMLCASALLAPIRLLPPEIMGEIFLLYIRPDGTTDTWRSPLFLSSICWAWHSIVAGTPHLWVHLTVQHPSTAFQFTNLVASWFERAGNLALSLDVSESIDIFSPDPLNLETMSRKLDRIWPRIEALKFNIDLISFGPTPAFNSILEHSINLNGLVLRLRDRIVPPKISSYFAQMKNLRQVTIISNNNQIHFSSNHFLGSTHLKSLFPLFQLTHLSMQRLIIERDDWLDLMEQCCGSLEQGSFLIDPTLQHFPTVKRSEPVSYPNLVSLAIIVDHDMTLTIFSHFRFPSLTSFSLSALSAHRHRILWDCAVVRNLVARRLNSITLSRIQIGPQELVKFVRYLPNIRSLEAVDVKTDYNPFIERLALPGDAKTFVPRLTFLTLKNTQEEVKTAQFSLDGPRKKIDRAIMLRMLGVRQPSQNEPGSMVRGRFLISVSIDNSFF